MNGEARCYLQRLDVFRDQDQRDDGSVTCSGGSSGPADDEVKHGHGAVTGINTQGLEMCQMTLRVSRDLYILSC